MRAVTIKEAEYNDMAGEITIRCAVAGDAAACREIATAAYGCYVERIGREPAPMVADFDTHIAQDQVWLAFADDDPVGFAVAFEEGGRARLENIAVLPDCQGSGTGSALMRTVEAWARTAGLGVLELYTNVAMTESIAWYGALRFTETKRVVEDGFSRVYFERAVPPGTAD